MVEPIIIDVIGSSQINRRPERGVLNISISSAGPIQGDVSQEVTSTSNKLTELFRSLAPKDEAGMPAEQAAITVFSIGSLRSWSHLKKIHRTTTGQNRNKQQTDNSKFNNESDSDSDSGKGPKEEIRIYEAEISASVFFRDFDKMGEVASQLSTMPHVGISSINWHVTDETMSSLERESRKLSIANAIKAAEDYVEVFGYRVFPVKIVAEGAISRGRMKQTARMAPASFRASPPSTALNLEPVDVEVTDTVTVVFQGLPK